MRTDAGGARFYEASDVSHDRVRRAMRDVGDRITAERIAEMRSRGKQPCNSIDARTQLVCTDESLAVYLVGPRCARHTPAAERGLPENRPTCNAPLRCYCSKHVDAPDPHDENDRARAELQQRELAWVNAVKSDVLQLARARVSFTIAELAEHMPPARSPERSVVEQSLLALLAEGVERGLIVKHPDRNEWKGAT